MTHRNTKSICTADQDKKTIHGKKTICLKNVDQFVYSTERVRDFSYTPKADAGTIYLTMRDQLEKYVKNRISSSMDAEDLIQEILLRIHENVSGIRDDAKVAIWVFSIARNAIIDFYRKHHLYSQLNEDTVALQPEDFAENQISCLVADGVRLLLELLPEKYRIALLKTEYEKVTQIQLAKELGLNISTIKSRVQRGRMKLKDLLLEFCHMEFDRYGTIIDCYPTGCDYCKELKKK